MKNLILFIVLVLSFGACKKDKSEPLIDYVICPYDEEAPPRYMSVPDSVKVDSTINVFYDYNNQKHCQKYDSVYDIIIGNIHTLRIMTKIDSCYCQDQFGPQWRYYSFTVHNPGLQIIKFHVVDTLYYVDTTVVY